MIDVRGWGYLTGRGSGALALDADTASRLQDELGRLVASAPDMADTGAFLLARLAEFEQTVESESGAAVVRDWHGHVAPAVARFRAAIAKATGEAS
jgi:hypothetical protein